MKNRRSLRGTLLGAWLIPAVLAGAISLGVFFALGWLEYGNAMSRMTSDLSEKSRAVARRLSAEILIGPRGAVNAVGETLRTDFGLESVAVSTFAPKCSPSGGDSCVENSDRGLVVVREIPGIQDPRFVRVQIPLPSYWRDLHFSLLLWIALPMGLLLGLGLIAQHRLIRHYIVRPIESLATHASGSSEAPPHWPTELSLLSRELHDAFLQRDQAMVGQITSGVIHDIRTKIHSISTALEMIDELPHDSPKRASRLEGLHRACSVHLPKVKSIIEATLDGSRTIPIVPKYQDIRETVRATLEQHQDYAVKRKVSVEVCLPDSPIRVSYDAIQLERALGNILKNGIEAFDDSGVTDRKLRIFAYRQEHDVQVGVEDNGPGLAVSPNILLASMRSTKTHGTGLGLLIARKIVEGHGGKLMAKNSTHLAGALFEMSIPAGDA